MSFLGASRSYPDLPWPSGHCTGNFSPNELSFTLRSITKSGRSGENGHSDMLGYQVNCLSSYNNVVRVSD